VAELADARDLKSRGLRAVRVRFPPPALLFPNVFGGPEAGDCADGGRATERLRDLSRRPREREQSAHPGVLYRGSDRLPAAAHARRDGAIPAKSAVPDDLQQGQAEAAEDSFARQAQSGRPRRLPKTGVQFRMRIAAFAGLLLLAFPSMFRRDVHQSRVGPDTSFGPWHAMAHAIVGVRMESARAVAFRAESYTAHTATVLTVFKTHPRLASHGLQLTIFEAPCQFCTDHGKRPPWDVSGPIPAGSHWILFLAWDDERSVFRVAYAVF
jgi:hypothetical protein